MQTMQAFHADAVSRDAACGIGADSRQPRHRLRAMHRGVGCFHNSAIDLCENTDGHGQTRTNAEGLGQKRSFWETRCFQETLAYRGMDLIRFSAPSERWPSG